MRPRADFRTITVTDPGWGLLVDVTGATEKAMIGFGVPFVWSRRKRAFRIRRTNVADVRAMCQWLGTYVVREVTR